MRSLLMLASLPLILAACSSGGDDGVTPPTNQSIGLVLSPAAGTVIAGGSTSTSIVLNRVGFTGIVALSAESVPAGVTAAIAATQLVGSAATSTLSLNVAAGTAAGTSSITVRATGSGVAAATAVYTLTISAGATPSITLAAGSSAVSVIQGTTATVPLTITRAGGFAGAVNLTAAGLPTGVTAAFAPASLGAGITTSTLTLTVAANAPVGTSPIVVTAAGTGVTAQTATVALTITAATQQDFSITATPAALSLAAGQSGTSAIALTRSGGFTGNVTFSLVGAPTGVTGVFAPNPTNTNASTLTISSTAAVTPGTYNLSVLGQGQLSGFTALSDRTTALTLTVGAGPGVTIATIGAQSLSQGSSTAAIGLVLTRTGGLTGDLTLALEGAPTGVTGVFTPNPATGAGSQLVLSASGTAAPGTSTLVVRATSGAVSATTSFALTVTAVSQGNYALSSVPATLSVVQGQTGLSTLNIARAGGFTGAVNLTVTGLPTGAAGTFTPAVATGTQSSLGIAVGATTPTGTYALVVRGQFTGLADVTTTLSLTVTAGNTGGGGNIAFRFCAQNSLPTFFAYRSGTSGAWTALSPSNNTFSFSLNQSVGQVAFAQPDPNGGAQVTVLNYAASEFPNVASAQCLTNPATKTVTGVVAGLAAGQSATISVGTGSATVQANGAFSITNATDGTTDLIATRNTAFNVQTFSQTVDKVIIRRNINPPAGGSLGATIDFGASEAVNPASASVTVNNVAGETLQGFTTFQTANGASGSFFNLSATQTSPLTMLGVPATLTQAGDYHITTVFASTLLGGSNINSRSIFQYNRDLAARTVTLGAAASVPTYTTVATAPYARIRVQGSWQGEYGDFMDVVYGQANQREWSITTSRAFAGLASSTFDAEIPDLSGVAGFNNSWGLVAGVSTLYSFNVYAGFTGLTAISEGTQLRIATRSTTQTP